MLEVEGTQESSITKPLHVIQKMINHLGLDCEYI